MLWLILSLLTAFFEAMKGILSKISLDKNIDEYVLAWFLRFSTFLFALPVLFFIKIPTIGNQFWMALLISAGLNILATIYYMKALKHSDISLSYPLISFTPLFLLITSPIIVGEFPSSYGLIGILIIVFGAYFMNISHLHKGLFAPLKYLLKEKGPKSMLIVAFLYSIISNYDKIGILNSSPVFWVISNNFFIALGLFPIMLLKSRNIKKQIIPNLRALVPIGMSSALLLICQMTAIKLTLVVYVISVKRTSAIMSIIMGCLFLKEKNIKERLFGAAIMLIGVILIAMT